MIYNQEKGKLNGISSNYDHDKNTRNDSKRTSETGCRAHEGYYEGKAVLLSQDAL